MVAIVTQKNSAGPNPVLRALLDLGRRLPWERLLVTGGAAGIVVGAAASPSRENDAPSSVAKPGCAAADATLLVQGYLDGLARGNGGFGVLALGKTRLEEGASTAAGMGQSQLAAEMRAVAAQLPNVRSRDDAAKVAQQLRPVTDKAWRLGRICGLSRKK